MQLGSACRVSAAADAEADLRQARALAHHDRETSAGRSRRRAGPRSPPGIWSKAETPSAMTRVNTSSRPVELFGLVAAHRSSGQRQALEQRHDVDAAGLQHRALRQARSRAAAGRRAWRRPRVAGPRQEARAHAVGHVAEAQIEARRLQLVGQQRLGELDVPRRRSARGSPAPAGCPRSTAALGAGLRRLLTSAPWPSSLESLPGSSAAFARSRAKRRLDAKRACGE